MTSRAPSRSWPRLGGVSLLTALALTTHSACDNVDPCSQLIKDLNAKLEECDREPVVVDGPDGARDGSIASLNECLGQCYNDASCEALELGTPEQLSLEACSTSCHANTEGGES